MKKPLEDLPDEYRSLVIKVETDATKRRELATIIYNAGLNLGYRRAVEDIFSKKPTSNED